VREAQARLEALGFEVDLRRDGLLVRGVPALLGEGDQRSCWKISRTASPPTARTSRRTRQPGHLDASHQRRWGARSSAEVAALLQALDGLTYGSNAHGRPVSVEFTRGQVERMFGR
jgi:hypothetical protein